MITGAAGGIGGALARGFAAAGAKLIACDLNPRIHELAAQWRESAERTGYAAQQGRHHATEDARRRQLSAHP